MAIYMRDSRGVEVSNRSSTVDRAKRLTQAVRRGVTGRQAVSKVNSPVMVIQDKGYSTYFAVL
jgi:hypothetical protein